MTRKNWKKMPEPVKTDSGCKVGWFFYDKKRVADQAAKIARHNGEIDAALGYDFGFQVPGEIIKVGNLYRVTHP